MGLPDPRQLQTQPPVIGRHVIYRSKRNPYDLSAIVTATVKTLWPEGVERGDVPPLDSEMHAHLHVFTPGMLGSYQEHNIPFAAVQEGEEVPPGSWRWPTFQNAAAVGTTLGGVPGPASPPQHPDDRPVG